MGELISLYQEADAISQFIFWFIVGALVSKFLFSD